MTNTLWEVIAAYIFAVAGGSISASLHLEHKPLCALISFAAGTLLGVTIFAILPESFGACPWWAVLLALITGYALFFFISKHVHHVCPACAASHFDADATRHFSEIANALIVALAIHRYDRRFGFGNPRRSTCDWCGQVVVVLRSMHPQSSRRPRARQPFDRRRTATLGSGWMGGSGRIHNAPRWCHRLFLPDEHLHLVAGLNYGARRRRVYLFGYTRSGRRNVEAWKEARFDELCAGFRSNRGSQCRVATAWVAHESRVVASASSRSRTFLKLDNHKRERC